jgi:hypothetical protein
MENLEKKVVVACRMVPDLKEQLAQEAEEGGLTLSSYIETTLAQRHFMNPINEDSENEDEKVFELQNRIEELEAQRDTVTIYSMDTSKNLELETQLKQVEREYLNLSQRFKDLMTEREALLKAKSTGLPNWLSQEYYNAVVNYVQQLKGKHQEYSHEQLLLSALAVTHTNENNLVTTYTMKDFWRRNPNFITSNSNPT